MKQIHVVAAVIYRTNSNGKKEVFATARGYGDYKGWWEFPGGKIEHDESGLEIETEEEALIREIYEELDSTIKIQEKIQTVEWDYPQFHLIMECFACTLVKGKLTLLEAEDAKWLNADTLHNVKWLPADELILDKVKNNL